MISADCFHHWRSLVKNIGENQTIGGGSKRW